MSSCGCISSIRCCHLERQCSGGGAGILGVSLPDRTRSFARMRWSNLQRNTVRKYAEAKSPPMMRTRGRSRVSQSDSMTAA